MGRERHHARVEPGDGGAECGHVDGKVVKLRGDVVEGFAQRKQIGDDPHLLRGDRRRGGVFAQVRDPLLDLGAGPEPDQRRIVGEGIGAGDQRVAAFGRGGAAGEPVSARATIASVAARIVDAADAVPVADETGAIVGSIGRAAVIDVLVDRGRPS